MTNVRRARWPSVGLSVAVALLSVFLLGVTPAAAGIGGSDTPTWPATATVGDLIDASVFITNTSTNPNNTESVQLTNLFVTPACASGANSQCLGTDVDPGIFKVLSAIGDSSTAPCADIPFIVSGPNITTGEVTLTPTSAVTLGAVSGGVNLSCQVNLVLRVFQVPTNPASGPAVTTDPLTRAALVGVNSGLGGSAGGAAQIRIFKATPGLASTSNPNTNNVVPGTAVTDTATLTKANGAIAPTGSVRFILCQPNDVTGSGCPSPAGHKVGADKPLAGNSATSDATTDTTDVGKYCWRARYLGDANYNPVNHTNAITECFTVAPQTQPVLSIEKTPDGGTFNPGDTVTFTIVVTNDGPGAALNVTMDDTLPDTGLSWGPASPAPSCSGQSGASPTCSVSAGSPQVLNCTLGDLAEGGSCTIAVSTPTDAADCKLIQNTAQARADNAAEVSDPGSVSCSVVECPKPNAQFALGAAAQFAILELDGGALTLGTGATKISGNVGIGDNSTGSTLIKATIDGPLLVDCNASSIDIHSDLTATCGIAAKPPLNRAPFTDCVELDTPVQDALDASTALADTGLHPTDQTFTDITTDTTIFATHNGLNVISVTGSISLTGKTLAFDANAFTSVAFVVNVQGGLTCSGCTVTANAPLNFGDVLFNFPGSGADASVKGSSSTFSGTLLGPQRNCTLDKAQLTGAMLCGGGILVHSAAQLCPGFDFVCPGP